MTSTVNKPKKRIFNIIISAIVVIIVLCLFIFTVTMTVSPTLPIKLAGGNFVNMQDNSMGKDVQKGALCVYKPISNISDLKRGDKIVFKRIVDGADTIVIRNFKEIRPDITGNSQVIVMNHLDQEESYQVNSTSLEGKIVKQIPVLGIVYSILMNRYIMFLMFVVILILILQPIIFARVDMTRAFAKQQAQFIVKEQKRIDKLNAKAVKECAPRLVFYDYKYNPISKDNIAEPRISTVGALSVGKPREFSPKKSNATRNTMIVLLALALIILTSILFVESSNISFTTYNYQLEDIEELPADSKNALKAIKPDAVLIYNDISLHDPAPGDIIVIRVKNNGVEGTSVRFLSRIEETNGQVMYYTYGVLDANGNHIVDNRAFSDSEVVGLYSGHNNAIGKICSFVTSTWMYALVIIFFLLLLLMLIYYKISNKLTYMPVMTNAAKKLLANSENIATVKSVSTASKAKSLVGLTVLLLTFIVVIGTSLGLGYGFKAEFKEITSTLSSNPNGSYSMTYNKANIKVGDKVVHKDSLTVGSETVELLSIKYVVDISGDRYILGVSPGVADYVGSGSDAIKLSVLRNQIVGKELFTINKFNKVLLKLKSKELIIVYIILGFLVLSTIIASSLYSHIDTKRLGLVQNVLSNTFVELNSHNKNKYLRKAELSKSLPFTDQYSRAAYNLIKNFMLSYKKITVVDNKIYEQYYYKNTHVLSLEIKEGKLYAYTNLDIKKFSFFFTESSTILTRKFKQPRNRIGVFNDAFAAEFIRLIESQFKLLSMKKKKKSKVRNYANSHDSNAIIMTKAIISEKSAIV